MSNLGTFIWGIAVQLRGGQANSEKQFLVSPDLRDGVVDAVTTNNEDAAEVMRDLFYGDTAIQADLVRLVGLSVPEGAGVDEVGRQCQRSTR